MTRYSRSVMPGRAADAPDAGLDRMVFGAKRPVPRASARATTDTADPDFLPPVDEDEADLLIARSNTDRRGGPDRRQNAGRRISEYAPLREPGRAAHQGGEDNRRGPLLLAGALLIVVVFGVVVWNAYRDGVQTDSVESAPELSTAGAFKTPPRVVAEAPIVAEPALEVPDEPLAGAPADTTGEERPEPPTPAPAETQAAPTPAPSKVMAPPPAPLKPPTAAAPVQTAAAQLAPAKPVAATPAPATPTPAAPAPVVATKPGFAASGDHVVQIAATSSEASAATEWTRLQKAYADLLSGAERSIQQADVGGRTVYRLRVGSFASKANAVAFCAAFKAKGGNCLPAVK